MANDGVAYVWEKKLQTNLSEIDYGEQKKRNEDMMPQANPVCRVKYVENGEIQPVFFSRIVISFLVLFVNIVCARALDRHKPHLLSESDIIDRTTKEPSEFHRMQPFE